MNEPPERLYLAVQKGNVPYAIGNTLEEAKSALVKEQREAETEDKTAVQAGNQTPPPPFLRLMREVRRELDIFRSLDLLLQFLFVGKINRGRCGWQDCSNVPNCRAGRNRISCIWIDDTRIYKKIGLAGTVSRLKEEKR